ncbi:MAG: hypothetical protein ACRDEB_08960, partial [Chitinophagaceae bacterium]
AIPISIAGHRDRLPQSLLADGAYALNTIFLFRDVKVDQFSDPVKGLQYFNDMGNDIELCEEKRMKNIMPFIQMDGALSSKGSGRTTVYFFRGTDPVDIKYRAFGEYRIGIIFQGKYYEVKGMGHGDQRQFRLNEMQPVRLPVRTKAF